MSIQYSGSTLVNVTYTQSTGTRAELADQINTQLVNAGWTSVTNSASNYTLTSATTPYGLKCKVNVFDPGTGNCTQLKFSDGNGTNTQTNALYLLPAASQVWRMLMNKYQLFVKAPSLAGTRQFAAGGVLWVPSFLSIAQAAWSQGNATSDTDVGSHAFAGFHGSLTTDAQTGTGSQGGNAWNIWNASVLNASAPGSGSGGAQRLLAQGACVSTLNYQGRCWGDSTLLVYEPLMMSGAAALADEGMVRGQLWDAIVIADGFAAETQISFDGHTWQAITHNNSGGAAYARGTIFICVA